jgi:hypothetical protein
MTMTDIKLDKLMKLEVELQEAEQAISHCKKKAQPSLDAAQVTLDTLQQAVAADILDELEERGLRPLADIQAAIAAERSDLFKKTKDELWSDDNDDEVEDRTVFDPDGVGYVTIKGEFRYYPAKGKKALFAVKNALLNNHRTEALKLETDLRVHNALQSIDNLTVLEDLIENGHVERTDKRTLAVTWTTSE